MTFIQRSKIIETLYRMSRLLLFLLNYQRIKNCRHISQSALFDSSFYLQQYDNLNLLFKKFPHIHYIVFGCLDGTNPNPFFDSQFYKVEQIDRIPDGMDPLVHYLFHGFDEQFHPFHFFDTQYYLEDNPAIAQPRTPLLMHYIWVGESFSRWL